MVKIRFCQNLKWSRGFWTKNWQIKKTKEELTNSSLTLSDLSQSEKHKMYLKYPKVCRRKLESSSTEMRIFLPKLTFESLSIWKMHSSFQSLESKVFMRKVASLNSLLLGWIEQLSSMQRLWNWFLFGTHKKREMICILVQTFLPSSPHFFFSKEKFWCIIKKCAESSFWWISMLPNSIHLYLLRGDLFMIFLGFSL